MAEENEGEEDGKPVHLDSSSTSRASCLTDFWFSNDPAVHRPVLPQYVPLTPYSGGPPERFAGREAEKGPWQALTVLKSELVVRMQGARLVYIQRLIWEIYDYLQQVSP